jgi:phospholipase/lecithinase/hemolysin
LGWKTLARPSIVEDLLDLGGFHCADSELIDKLTVSSPIKETVMAALQHFLGDLRSSLQSALNVIGIFAARAAASGIPVPQTTAGPGAPYSAMYVFGDSLTDTGNVSLATAGLIPVLPPYQDRSFTNGAVWAQDLAQAIDLPSLKPNLGGGTDFAYGGAETGQTPVHAATALDLPSQYAQYIAQISSPQAGALYAVWIGSNDVLDIADNSSLSPAQQQADVSIAVNNEVSFISELVQRGAQNLLVLNVPDLGKTPYEVARGPTAVQSSSSLALLYDADLANALLPLAASGSVKVDLIDTFGVLDHAVDNPSAYGFQNATDPVWTGNITDPSSGTLQATGTDQNSYVFFDALHPTSQTHALLASGIAKLLTSSTLQLLDPHMDYEMAVSSGNGAVVEDTATNLMQMAWNPEHIIFADGAGRFDPTGGAGEIARLYQAALDRAPDAAGLDYWTVQLDSRVLNIDDVALSFISSAEFTSRFGTLDNQGFVERLYENLRGGAGDPGGVQYWASSLDSGASRAQVLMAFSDSVENENNTRPIAGDADLSEAYRLYGAFDRSPDTAGLDYWAAQLQAGATPLQVAQGFVDSAEFAGIYGTLDAKDFVDLLYQNVLHRTADTAGEQYWVTQLNSGASQAQVLLGFSDSLDNRLNTSQATHDGLVFLPSATS